MKAVFGEEEYKVQVIGITENGVKLKALEMIPTQTEEFSEGEEFTTSNSNVKIVEDERELSKEQEYSLAESVKNRLDAYQGRPDDSLTEAEYGMYKELVKLNQEIDDKLEIEEMAPDFRLCKEQMGYVIYREADNRPVLSHTATPLLFGQDSGYGSMEEVEISDDLKLAVLMYHKVFQNRENGDNLEAQTYHKVLKQYVMERLDLIEQSIVNTVVDSVYGDGKEPSRLTRQFRDYCISTVDPVKHFENKMKVDGLIAEVKEKLEDQQGEDE